MVTLPKATVNGYADVAQHLRNWIIDTPLAPGEPLPKQTDIASCYRTSILTVSRAMRELQDDGLVVAVRRAGSFVAEAPPHLTHYGLLLTDPPLTSVTNRHMLALARAAEVISADGVHTIRTYQNIMENRPSRDREQLDEDLKRRRLAGLIFASPPDKLGGQAIVDAPGLPRVAIMADTRKYPHIARVSNTSQSFAERAFERLAELGCRTIGAIINIHAYAQWDAWLTQLAPDYGLQSRPEWLQGASPSSPLAARQMAHLLLSHPGSRPDALIISDDNLVEQATIGIARSGVQLPVIVHANFPWTVPTVVPVQQLGFDSVQTLNHCLAALQQQQQGHDVPPLTTINAIFDDEYAARSHVAIQHELAPTH